MRGQEGWIWSGTRTGEPARRISKGEAVRGTSRGISFLLVYLKYSVKAKHGLLLFGGSVVHTLAVPAYH